MLSEYEPGWHNLQPGLPLKENVPGPHLLLFIAFLDVPSLGQLKPVSQGVQLLCFASE